MLYQAWLWFVYIGGGVWLCLEVLVKALAVAWLYNRFRDGESDTLTEGDDG